MREEYNYQEIMDKMNKVAKIVDARGHDGAPCALYGDKTRYKELAKMYKYYSLNKEKFTEEEQKKIERGIVRKAQGWLPYTLYYNCDGTKYLERLFKSLNKIKTLDSLFV